MTNLDLQAINELLINHEADLCKFIGKALNVQLRTLSERLIEHFEIVSHMQFVQISLLIDIMEMHQLNPLDNKILRAYMIYHHANVNTSVGDTELRQGRVFRAGRDVTTDEEQALYDARQNKVSFGVAFLRYAENKEVNIK